MLPVYRLGRPSVSFFLTKKWYASDIPVSTDSLIGRQKAKSVPPSALDIEPDLKTQQNLVEDVTSDLLTNAELLSTIDPKASKTTFPMIDPSTINTSTDINIPSDSLQNIASISNISHSVVSPVLSETQAHMDVKTTAMVDVAKQQEELLKLALPFDEVPGPTILKFLAKVYSYLPLVGTQITASAMMYFLSMLGSNLVWNRSAKPFIHMFDKYGPVVRLQGIFGGNIVFVSRPEHIETVFQQEGRYPVRSSLDSIETYRVKHRKMRTLGPFIISGPDWESLRSKLEIPIQKNINHYHAKMDFIADEMIARIYSLRNRQEEVPETFVTEIYKWSLENICMVSLGKRLGLLDPAGLSITSESIRLLEAVQTASQALRECESGFQLWRFFETRSWQTLVASCDVIDSIAAKYIRIVQTNLHSKEDGSMGSDNKERIPFLESLMLNENMNPDDIFTVVLDMFLIGVNATSHALCYLLYQLSKNQRAQRCVYDELVKVMPKKDSSLSISSLKQLHYLHAALKESLRLQPPIPVITRILPHDIALHCYKIPKGTYILMTSHVTSLREENFEDAYKFKPDRWLTEGEDIHPFAAIPFGHGPRSCVGRGLAEIQLWLTIAKIIRNFRVEYHYGHISPTTKMIEMPGKSLKLTFVERPK